MLAKGKTKVEHGHGIDREATDPRAVARGCSNNNRDGAMKHVSAGRL